ncbi:hypothetical protein D6C95_10079 [Aureobasidium pullulans]|nr:hypothetical protein D6C95_10079 [Aureobasidium pullulans]
MAHQPEQQLRINPHAQERYNHLCTTHGSSPTSDDVVSIQRTIGTLSTGSKIVNRFEPALLFFLRRSAVQFEAGALLIGWTRIPDGSRMQVWFRVAKEGTLYPLPSDPPYSRYYPGEVTCDEWHPVVDDIIDPEKCISRLLQYAYLHSYPDDATAASTNDTAMIDLTDSDDEIAIKPELEPDLSQVAPQEQDPSSPIVARDPVISPVHVNDNQHLAAQLEQKMQAFRNKLEGKDVTELQDLSEKQPELPKGIMKLVGEVLQKKMLEDLEMAESYFL